MSFRGIRVLAIGLSVAACNALTGASELSVGDGADIGLPGDRSGGDDAGPSGSGDATTSDGSGGPSKDASTDAIVGDDSGGGTFCSALSNAAFCTDFDQGALVGWGKSVTNGASVDLTSMGALSSPNALRASSGTNTSTNRIAYYSRKIGNVDVAHARLSYALFIEQRPTFGEIEINGLVFEAPDASEFYLAVDDKGANIVEQLTKTGSNASSTYHSIGSAIPTGKWMRVTLEVTLTGTRVLVLKVDGTEVMNTPLTMTGPGIPTLRGGLTWAGMDSSTASFLVDDVAFEILP